MAMQQLAIRAQALVTEQLILIQANLDNIPECGR